VPADASVSASTALVPRLSSRSHVYVFPAVQDADYVFLDLQSTPAPTSARDVYVRVSDLQASGGWRTRVNDDGLLLLERDATAVATQIESEAVDPSITLATPTLIAASLVPPPDGAVDVDGPRWILRTTWRIATPLPAGTRPTFRIDLAGGDQLRVWDVADLWWNPPDRWRPGESVTVDVPNVPMRRFSSWTADWQSTP